MHCETCTEWSEGTGLSKKRTRIRSKGEKKPIFILLKPLYFPCLIGIMIICPICSGVNCADAWLWSLDPARPEGVRKVLSLVRRMNSRTDMHHTGQMT